MKAYRYRSPRFESLEAVKSFYEVNAKRSRTYVNGVKAVRIDKRAHGRTGMANCVVYPEQTMLPDGVRKATGNFCVRLYSTDVLVYRPDGTVVINSGGFETNTTFARIEQGCGVNISSMSGVQKHRWRIWTSSYRDLNSQREGKAPNWIRMSVPFVDGLVVRLSDSEIMNPEIIPSDVRKSEMKPNAQVRKEFRPKWKPVQERMLFSINLGEWADSVLADEARIQNWSREIAGIVAKDEVPTGEMLLSSLLYVKHIGYWIIRRANPEEISAELKKGISKLRSAVQYEYARQTGQLEDIGGKVLGNGYYVAGSGSPEGR